MSDTVKSLPVFQTVGDSIKYTVGNLGLMIQLVWFWGMLIVAVTAGISLAGGSGVLWILYFGVLDPDAVWSATNVFLFCALFLLYVIAGYSIAVGWHRGLLLDERSGGVHASLGKPEFSYFLRTLAIFVVFILLIAVFSFSFAVLAGIVGQKTQLGQALVVVGVFAGMVASLLLWARLVLVLPGAAVGDRRVSFRTSWSLTKANTWRLVGGFLLIGAVQFLLSFAVFFVLGFIVGFSGNDWGQFSVPKLETGIQISHVAIRGIQLFVSVVLGFLVLSYMSYCYWFFVPPPGQDDLA